MKTSTKSAARTTSLTARRAARQRRAARLLLCAPLLLLAVAALTVLRVGGTRGARVLVRQAAATVALPLPRSARRVVVLTAINFAFRHYVLNLACSLHRAGLSPRNLLVFALDERAHRFASDAGLTSVMLGAGGESQEAMFGTRQFNLLSKRKLAAVKAVLDAGLDVLFTDADVVWCRGAFANVARLADDATSDLLVQTAWPRSLLNSGFYYAKSNAATRALFGAFLGFPADSENDQVVFNRVMCNTKFGGSVLANLTAEQSSGDLSSKRGARPLGCRWRDATAHVLSPQLFPTGGEIVDGQKIFHLSRRRIIDMCDAGSPFVLHNNCILSDKKLSRFIVKGIWYVNPAVVDNNEDDNVEDDAFENDVAADENDGAKFDFSNEHDLHRVCGEPVPPTYEMRRRCGSSKCGDDGDVHRFPHMTV